MRKFQDGIVIILQLSKNAAKSNLLATIGVDTAEDNADIDSTRPENEPLKAKKSVYL